MAATNEVDVRSDFSPRADRPLKELVAELGRDSGLLIRQEVELAKTELKEYASRILKVGIGIGAGSLIAYGGVLTLNAALVLVLIKAGVVPWLAAGIVGTAAVAGGYGVIQGARRRASKPPVLARTKRITKETVQWAKEQLP